MHTAPTSIPEHLKPFVSKQDPSLYTPMDHATWRFILRISQAFFKEHAHQKYLDGLTETGISTDRIPLVSEMDERLQRFGWRAVPVSGFIPPAAFMEFQSLGILPIACEMRTIEHLAYTPAPDIVHEAAGHAPIIADPEYAAYLRAYGEISRKAIFSSQDMEVYHAIYRLSVVKEYPSSTAQQIAEAQREFESAVASIDFISEASLMSRMNWWTVEYGLVGTLEQPKIYGAGLLSSVGESFACLSPKVEKRELSLECIQVSYDITRPQPQLFVTRDFQQLTRVLEQFADTMAFRRGGKEGLDKAVKAKTITTTTLDSGVQISGILERYRTDSRGDTAYLFFQGPVQLARADRELPGQGPASHSQGFSTPIGPLRPFGKSPAQLLLSDLAALGFSAGKKGRMEFQSGVMLEGRLIGEERNAGVLSVLSFEDCTISWNGETLYQPAWGRFDLACGTRIASVFGGPADRGSYYRATGALKQDARKPKSNLTSENQRLNELYSQVRSARSGTMSEMVAAEIWGRARTEYPRDWLLAMELLELAIRDGLSESFQAELRSHLEARKSESPEISTVIERGLAIL